MLFMLTNPIELFNRIRYLNESSIPSFKRNSKMLFLVFPLPFTRRDSHIEFHHANTTLP